MIDNRKKMGFFLRFPLIATLAILTACGGGSDGSKSSSPAKSSSNSSSSAVTTSYNLTYSAGAGGSVSGQISQSVVAGSSGSSVTAVAAANYRFAGWSDGSLKAARTDNNIQQNVTLTANFVAADLWVAAPYSGQMSLEVLGPRSINVVWEGNEPRTIMVSTRNDVDANIGEIADVNWHVNVTPPFKLENLNVDQPVYVAIQRDDVITAWSSTTPRSIVTNGPIQTMQLMDNGNIFIGGAFQQIGPGHGTTALLPSAQSGVDTSAPLAFPSTDKPIWTAVSDGNNGWYIGGDFKKVGTEDRAGFAHIDHTGKVLPWMPVEGQITQIVKKENALYIAGNYKTASHPYATAVASFEEGKINPTIYKYLGEDESHRVNSIALSDSTIYIGGTFVGGYRNIYTSLAAMDYQGNFLDWPKSANGLPVVKVIELNNNVYVMKAGPFMGNSFWEINAQGEEKLLVVDIADQSIYNIYRDEDYLYISGSFSTTAPNFVTPPTGNNSSSKEFNLLRLDTSGNVTPLKIPELRYADAPIAINKGVVYFSDTNSETSLRVIAFTFPDLSTKKMEVFAGDSLQSIFPSDDLLLLSGAQLLPGGRAQTNLALINDKEELLPWVSPDIGEVYASTKVEGIFYSGGNEMAAFDENGNRQSWKVNLVSRGQVEAGWPPMPPNITTMASHKNQIYIGGNFNLMDESNSIVLGKNFVALNQSQQLLWKFDQPIYDVGNIGVNSEALYVADVLLVNDAISQYDHQGNFIRKIDGIEGLTPFHVGETKLFFRPEINQLKAMNTSGDLLDWQLEINEESSNGHPSRIQFITTNNEKIFLGMQNLHWPYADRKNALRVYDQTGNLLEQNNMTNITGLHVKGDTLLATSLLDAPLYESHYYFHTIKIFDLNKPLADQ
ncbi:InlB B-repeat-containing protein [Cellvibrio polysaccharolyticus]|uniref:Bacterial repeat domain-containing protein n=1 Tax=Cellvibrio polysaccharolyticus TaxID=2082724 RepID=A0A928V1R0_9GAMM|nr:hypothetical protein [Cellvibrio polysaccharolyticus]MBE8716692.1 hypothetical protein [Cellvibrio polysaccharolyticus]